jgi:predicted HAD superfamily phosphohydrolase
MFKYTDITQNTYIQSSTVTEILAKVKWGLIVVPNTVTRTADRHVTQLMSLRLIPGMNNVNEYTKMSIQQIFISTSLQLAIHAHCKVLGNPKDHCGVNASVYVVQFNSFMSLIR